MSRGSARGLQEGEEGLQEGLEEKRVWKRDCRKGESEGVCKRVWRKG